ncbi:50S ribosomal protein L23 [Blattabacterium cuenoti]|uniref:50S ribosomal protein L23 n=1 Tax=Blattabacterium cuenoti TaxID=1653831 RepID=UPI00163BC311|nr:50S ribosomal protein L23 [Blattabacterium cuenoti]
MIFIKPFLTEKDSKKKKKVSSCIFSVNVNSNKIQIKKEFKKIFGFSAKDVKTMIYPKKDKSKYTKKGFLCGKTNKMKKAIIHIEKNQKIDFFNKKEI